MRLVSELWKSVGIVRGVDFTGLYEVSTKGRIRNARNLNIITYRHIDVCGYIETKMYREGRRIRYPIHRLVAIAFLINPNSYDTVNHKDEIKTNNDVNNLEWCSRSYNTTYGTAVERRTAVGRRHFVPVIQIDADGNIVARYNSISEAARAGFNKQMVYNCIHGINGTHRGYRWEIDGM